MPDHQEVYLAANGFSSLIFDLGERVDASIAPSDRDALLYHFEDVVDEGDGREVVDIETLSPSPLSTGAALPLPNFP